MPAGQFKSRPRKKNQAFTCMKGHGKEKDERKNREVRGQPDTPTRRRTGNGAAAVRRRGNRPKRHRQGGQKRESKEPLEQGTRGLRGCQSNSFTAKREPGMLQRHEGKKRTGLGWEVGKRPLSAPQGKTCDGKDANPEKNEINSLKKRD